MFWLLGASCASWRSGTHAVYQRAGGSVCRPAKNSRKSGVKEVQKEGVMLDFNELIRMLKNNLIVLIVILYIFFMASFKIWPVW